MTELSDDKIVAILDKVVASINPVLDVLTERDVLGVKQHTFHPWPAEGPRLHQAIHLVSTPLEIIDWPGTEGWEALSMKARVAWWITRVGGINTIAVAFPSVFGIWARYLPASALLGFANQAIVLVAIAREHGVVERKCQVELLASVLCGRTINAESAGNAPAVRPPRGRSLIATVWNIATMLRELSGELEKRPSPAKPFDLLRSIPLVGAPFSYIGERFALSRAAKLGRKWIDAHPDAVATTGGIAPKGAGGQTTRR